MKMSGKKVKHQRREEKGNQGGLKDPSKRRLLQAAVAAAALAVVPTVSYIVKHISYDDRWAFLERGNDRIRDYHSSPLGWKFVANNYVPMGEQRVIMPGTREFEEIRLGVEPEIIKEIKKRGFDIAEYKVAVTRQEYGVPDEARYTESVVDYCKKAVDFLYDHILGLERHVIDWTPINQKDNFETGFNQKGLIGHSFYEVEIVSAANKADKKQSITLGRSQHQTGSFNNMDFYGKWWYIFIGAGDPHTIIKAPFSEVIPLTITNRTYEYRMQFGYDKAIQAGETVAEAISYRLGLMISKEFGIPNGKRLVEASMGGLDTLPEYRSVPQAIRWIDKNSMQAAFNLYMESPKKFMDAIRA